MQVGAFWIASLILMHARSLNITRAFFLQFFLGPVTVKLWSHILGGWSPQQESMVYSYMAAEQGQLLLIRGDTP